MRLAFAGTPAFAALALSALLEARFRVERVLTRPDRPRGRGLRAVPSAVKQLALERGLPVTAPPTFKDAEVQAELGRVPIDLLIVAAYGVLLPPAILAWPRLGCVNIHASLLPRWRGAAPIQRALLAGDRETGVSLMQMDAGLDTGPVIATYPVPITYDTGGSLHDKLAATGAAAIVALIGDLQQGATLVSRPQAVEGITYAAKIERSEAHIDWREDAVHIERRIRAFDPSPGASTTLDGKMVKLWQAEAAPGRMGTPGMIVAAQATGIVIACGDGALVVHALQLAGGRRLPVGQFLAGHRLEPGERFV